MKGWCFETSLFSSSLYSKRGKSTTHKKQKSFLLYRLNFSPRYSLKAPRAVRAVSLFISATINIISFSLAFVILYILSISSCFKNFSEFEDFLSFKIF